MTEVCSSMVEIAQPPKSDHDWLMDMSEEEKKVFKDVDRKREDQLVREYRRNGDMSILDELYKMREQTLWVWARKYHQLDNLQDMFAEFRAVWLKCVNKYQYNARLRPVKNWDGSLVRDEQGQVKMTFKRTPFNTYLFTALRNRAWNIRKRHHAQKMLDGDGNSVVNTMMSLDYEYGEGDDASTLLDCLADASQEDVVSALQVKDIIDEVACGDAEVQEALRVFVDNPQIKRISTACRIKCGRLKITSYDYCFLAKRDGRSFAYLKSMVEATNSYPPGFRVIAYYATPASVEFEVCVDNPDAVRKIRKAVADCRDRFLVASGRNVRRFIGGRRLPEV